MDSEDEGDPRRNGFYLRTRFDRRNRLELRLYEAKEARASRSDRNRVGYYRLRRFFASIEGFHKVSNSIVITNDPVRSKRCHQGSLDLTGRHASRYEELSMRWKGFIEGVMKTISHVREVEYHQHDDEIDIMMNEYLEKWNLDGAMSTSELLSHISMCRRIHIYLIG